MSSATTTYIKARMKTINKQRVTIFVNPAIAKQARAQAVLEGLCVTSLIEKALLNYLPKETVIRKAVATKDFGQK
jgi:hypothetical protein